MLLVFLVLILINFKVRRELLTRNAIRSRSNSIALQEVTINVSSSNKAIKFELMHWACQ